MTDFSIIAVFLVGLLGGVHCLGMCGSIVGILTTQLPRNKNLLPFHLAYSIGRVASYGVAGALVGSIGAAGLLWRDQVPIQHLLFALSSLMLIALGLYLAGINSLVRRIEGLGGGLWRFLQPYTRRLFPVATLWRAFQLGMVWGWLPCGLVYSVLLTALASGSAQGGALIMLAFGLGTLPNLLLMGLFWQRVKGWVQHPRVRLVAGLLVAALGVYGLIKVGYTFYLNGWVGSCHVAA